MTEFELHLRNGSDSIYVKGHTWTGKERAEVQARHKEYMRTLGKVRLTPDGKPERAATDIQVDVPLATAYAEDQAVAMIDDAPWLTPKGVVLDHAARLERFRAQPTGLQEIVMRRIQAYVQAEQEAWVVEDERFPFPLPPSGAASKQA